MNINTDFHKKNLLMKAYIFFLLLFVIFSFPAKAQNPSYILNLANDQQVDDKNYEFDIYLQRTGATEFEYANNSQFFINFNPAIKNGGSLSFTVVSGSCELNLLQQVLQSKLSVDNVNNRFRIAAHTPSGAGTGTVISAGGLGTRIGRFRVTNTVSFGNFRPELSWYNGPTGFFTKIFAYVSSLNVEITNSVNHITTLTNSSLPVILTEFISLTGTGSIQLKWKTAGEINNKGFEIERKLFNGNWLNVVFVNGFGTVNEIKEYSWLDKMLMPGTYYYRLKQIDFNGNYEYYDLALPVIISKPSKFEISQNYPNPSNPNSRIDYQVPELVNVNITVYDMLGKEVAVLVNEPKGPGIYTAVFDGANISSGTYFYLIKAGDFKQIKKLILVK